MIKIRLNKSVLEVGEMLTGDLLGSPNIQKTIEKVIMSVGWRTEGRGNIESETIYKLELNNVPPSFNVRIPVKGPVSYDGKLIRIIWEVSLDIKYNGKFWDNRQESINSVFRVLPKMIEA